MPAAARTRKKPAIKLKVAAPALTGAALIRDMAVYRGKVTATRASARDFLMDLGVLSPTTGKPKKLIRG